MIIVLILILFALLTGYYFMYKIYKRDTRKLTEVNTTLLSQKKSSEVRLGQISEHLAPFLKDFKHNPKKAHFLGMPVDYIVFEDDEIIFLEIKSGKSQLSKTQQNIKKLVSDGKVSWEVMRID